MSAEVTRTGCAVCLLQGSAVVRGNKAPKNKLLRNNSEVISQPILFGLPLVGLPSEKSHVRSTLTREMGHFFLPLQNQFSAL